MTRASRKSEGKVVWVTGATSGIGKAIAELFASEGALVVATDVRPVKMEAAARIIQCDVSKLGDIANVAAACDDLGGVDVLVNSAGVLKRMDVMDVTPEIWDWTFNVNVKGMFLCCQAAVRSMLKAGKRGTIVNIGSINQRIVAADAVPYCSTKGAVHAMTRAIAMAAGPHGIRVHTVAPGAIADTDLEQVRWSNPKEHDSIRNRTPLGVIGTSRDIAPAVVFLCSDGAEFATGTEFFVDGGRTASV